jgi:hypothetical protein
MLRAMSPPRGLWALAWLAASVACGKTPEGKHDAGPGDAATEAAGDAPAGEARADAPPAPPVETADAVDDARDAASDGSAEASSDAAAEASADAADGAADADDPRCAADPGPGACVCDGFVMPNPASTNLPNPALYDASTAGIVVDEVTGLVWEKAPTTQLFTEPKAVTHCGSLTLAGRADWRLPTTVELVSIVDFTMTNGYDPAFDPTVRGSWSSTPFRDSQTGFTVDFASPLEQAGLVNFIDQVPVRCVRTGGAPPPRCYRAGARYSLDSADVATDRATGLSWRRHVLPSATAWSAAQPACAALGGGWRVPSVLELQTIVDHTVSAPSVDAVVFPGTPMMMDDPNGGAPYSPFWTSSAVAGDATRAWFVDFVVGSSSSTVRTYAAHVRCVR